MNREEITQSEQELIEMIRELEPYEQIDIKLKDNKYGEVVYTKTSKIRKEIKFD